MVGAYADRDIQRWHVQSMDEDEAAAWIDSWAHRWQQEIGAGWAVIDGAQVVGRVGLKRVDLDEALAEVAYGYFRMREGGASRRERSPR